MNRQRQLNHNSDPERYKSLLPEIANLLNTSVSAIERYPTDIQQALCKIYTDNYHSDQLTIQQALGRVVQLNSETEKQIEQAKQQALHQEQENKRFSAQAVLSRELIMESAKIIAEKNQQRNNRQLQNVEYGQFERKNSESE